ncbi:MAG: PQQ-binding-like beta-propeller repeat protein, partial [Anaerolineales bacterium]|nr:PQQ-binding-like beta-propeller repeat protein [Anaerolineales bacterium]
VVCANLTRLTIGEELPPPTPYSHTKITEISEQFSVQWQKEPVYISQPREGDTSLVSYNGIAILLGNLENNLEARSLSYLDMATGELVKENKAVNLRVNTVALTSQRLLVGVDGTQKISGQTVWGSSTVVAYNLATTDLLWQTKIPGARGITRLFASDEFVTVQGNSSTYNYVLDAATGEIVEELPYSDFWWFEFDGVRYEEHNQSVRAIELGSQKLRWVYAQNSTVPHIPFIDSETLVFRNGGSVSAHDTRSGRLLWQKGNLVRQIDIDGETLFYLTADLRLSAVHKATGEEIGHIQFQMDGPPDYSNHSYLMTASEGMVLVYFGDSRQLYAFQFSPKATHNDQ